MHGGLLYLKAAQYSSSACSPVGIVEDQLDVVHLLCHVFLFRATLNFNFQWDSHSQLNFLLYHKCLTMVVSCISKLLSTCHRHALLSWWGPTAFCHVVSLIRADSKDLLCFSPYQGKFKQQIPLDCLDILHWALVGIKGRDILTCPPPCFSVSKSQPASKFGKGLFEFAKQFEEWDKVVCCESVNLSHRVNAQNSTE